MHYDLHQLVPNAPNFVHARDFDENLEAREFHDKLEDPTRKYGAAPLFLEVRDFDDELEARGFDHGLDARDYDTWQGRKRGFTWPDVMRALEQAIYKPVMKNNKKRTYV